MSAVLTGNLEVANVLLLGSCMWYRESALQYVGQRYLVNECLLLYRWSVFVPMSGAQNSNIVMAVAGRIIFTKSVSLATVTIAVFFKKYVLGSLQ